MDQGEPVKLMWVVLFLNSLVGGLNFLALVGVKFWLKRLDEEESARAQILMMLIQKLKFGA
jgi:hypothetical protein